MIAMAVDSYCTSAVGVGSLSYELYTIRNTKYVSSILQGHRSLPLPAAKKVELCSSSGPRVQRILVLPSWPCFLVHWLWIACYLIRFLLFHFFGLRRVVLPSFLEVFCMNFWSYLGRSRSHGAIRAKEPVPEWEVLFYVAFDEFRQEFPAEPYFPLLRQETRFQCSPSSGYARRFGSFVQFFLAENFWVGFILRNCSLFILRNFEWCCGAILVVMFGVSERKWSCSECDSVYRSRRRRRKRRKRSGNGWRYRQVCQFVDIVNNNFSGKPEWCRLV